MGIRLESAVLLAFVHYILAQNDCLSNKDCPNSQLCAEFKCINPCLLNLCGDPSNCKVSNHIPICACKTDFSGPLNGDKITTPPINMPGEKKYQVVLEWMTWHAANVHCLSLGKRLATIESQADQDKLVKELKQKGGDGYRSWWLGGSDLAKSGYLWYSSGKHLTFRNFAEYQPDSHDHVDRGVEHCLEIKEDLGYRWNDILCEDKLRFVCESYESSSGIDVRHRGV